MSLRIKRAFTLWCRIVFLEPLIEANEALEREVAELRKAKAAALADEEAARASADRTKASLAAANKALLDQLRRRAADRDAQDALARAFRGDEAVHRAIDQAKRMA